MMSTISEAAVALDRIVELSILGKATVILVIGLTVVTLSRRARASVRHLLLAATLAAALVLPLLKLAVPEMTVGVPASSQTSESADIKSAAPSVALTAPTGAGLPSRATERAPRVFPSWLTIIRAVWGAGALLLLAQIVVDLLRLKRTRQEGLLWMESSELMRWLSGECGVRRKVEVFLHEGVPAPLTCGVWRPAILLPDEACGWNEADLRRALVHELEHVRRCDWAIQLAARATCVLYWFHPLVWEAFRRLSLEAERAADDAVVRSAEHTDYADQLLSLAGRLSKAQARSALGMANRSDLSARVSALLDSSQRRGRVGRGASVGALGVAGLVALTLAPARVAPQPGKQTTAPAQTPDSQRSVTGERGSSWAAPPPRKQTAAPAQAPGSQGSVPGEHGASGLDRALIRAAADGDISGIDELLQAGANVNCATEVNGVASSPLTGAARSGRLDAVRLLLDRGADPNLAVFDGSPLIFAAAEGHVDIVSLLLNGGASIDQATKFGDNALLRASANGHLEVVKLLVAAGANVNARGAQAVASTLTIGVTVDDWRWINLAAPREGVSHEKVRVTPKQVEWTTPLGAAARRGHKEVVDFLRASGARE